MGAHGIFDFRETVGAATVVKLAGNFLSYGKTIADKTAPGTPSGIPLKDLGLFKQPAEAADAPTPISTTLRDLLETLAAHG